MPNVERKASQGLDFNVYADGSCDVINIGSCKDTDIVIPADDGNGHKVTGIGWNAFQGCTDLMSVDIPHNVTYIGDKAFADCTGLTSVTIPDSVTTIRNFAFAGCAGLTSVDLPESVTTICYRAFEGCTGLESVSIPDGVTKIGSGAFRDCTDLTVISIPDSVNHIGDNVFRGCDSLDTIVCSAEMKEDLDRNRAFYAIPDNVNIVTPEAYASKEKENDGPSLDD